jgi:hypothetical protein
MSIPGSSRDRRVAAIAIIWGISAGMFALCIPLVAITHGDLLLPLAVVVSTVISTGIVWWSPQPSLNSRSFTPDELEGLSERIANLEVICEPDALPLLAPSELQPEPNEDRTT